MTKLSDANDGTPTAVEFFSGLGAFAAAAKTADIRVLKAFDQSAEANSCYSMNFEMAPISRNLDNLAAHDIPAANIWWLSPSCKPYTVRGNRKDVRDPRARSFLNIISAIPARKPETVIVENVSGFAQSSAREMFVETAQSEGMHVRDFDLCPTQFGIPMKRPRRFVVASHRAIADSGSAKAAGTLRPLREFFDEDADHESLRLDVQTLARFEAALNVIDSQDPSAVSICFTSNYWKCMRASGSFLREQTGHVRRFSPEEILHLLGFPQGYRFPPDLTWQARLRLAGNSVNVHCIIHLLKCLGYTSKVAPQRRHSTLPTGFPQ